MLRLLPILLVACNHAVPVVKIWPDRGVGAGELYGFDTSWTGPERVVEHPNCQKNRAGDCAVDLRFDQVTYRLGLECDRPCARWSERNFDWHQFGMVAGFRAGPMHVRLTMIPHYRPLRVETYQVTVIDPTSISVICMTESSSRVECNALNAYKLEVHGQVAGRDYRAFGVEIDGTLYLPPNATEREYLLSDLPHGRVQFALGAARTTVELR